MKLKLKANGNKVKVKVGKAHGVDEFNLDILPWFKATTMPGSEVPLTKEHLHLGPGAYLQRIPGGAFLARHGKRVGRNRYEVSYELYDANMNLVDTRTVVIERKDDDREWTRR